MSPSGTLGRVVVIGNSFAGLLTALALAEHADQVTIVDRDRIPDGPQPRSGIPQGRHIHVLLAAGQRAMEAMLPGLLGELAVLGVPSVGLPRDVLQINKGRWVRRWPQSIPFLTGTRALLEHVVRLRVLKHPRIDTLDVIDVVGLTGTSTRVEGIALRAKGETTRTSTIAADLVVDASGRGSRTPQWLTDLGSAAPAEERIETGLAYATRLYRAATDPRIADYKGIYLVPHPQMPRGGVVMPIEEDGEPATRRYLVTLSGLAGDEPPTDPEGFETFAARLEHPVLSEWMAAAEAEGPPMGYRNTANIRRRYERLDGPDGLLVVGDAACAFNPIYGQGMSVAALGAEAITKALADGRRTVRDLQRAVSAAAEQAWAISAGADRTMPGATGNGVAPGGFADKLGSWYLGRVEAHSASNVVVGLAFGNVIHLTAPVTSLFAWPVMRTVLFGRVKPGPSAPPLLAEAVPMVHAPRQPSPPHEPAAPQP